MSFQNEMTIPSKLIDGSIFTSAPISWNFQCSYDTSIEITSDEMSVDATSRTGDFSGTGVFDVEMRTVTHKHDRFYSKNPFRSLIVKFQAGPVEPMTP